MHYFVAYDISDNRLRRKTIKILERFGCVRIQKSVFLGTDLTPFDKKEVIQQLQTLLEEAEETDAIMFMPVDKELLSQVSIVGDSHTFRKALRNPNILMF